MAEKKKEDRAGVRSETRRGDASEGSTQTSTINTETEEVDVAGMKVKREVGYWVVGDQRYHSLTQAYRAAEAANQED